MSIPKNVTIMSRPAPLSIFTIFFLYLRYLILLSTCIKIVFCTVLFAQVSPAARRLAMATADSTGPGRQIESNTPTARRPTIE